MRVAMEAIAGAVARRKPAEVNKTEKAEKVSIRRKRFLRRGGDDEPKLELYRRALKGGFANRWRTRTPFIVWKSMTFSPFFNTPSGGLSNGS